MLVLCSGGPASLAPVPVPLREAAATNICMLRAQMGRRSSTVAVQPRVGERQGVPGMGGSNPCRRGPWAEEELEAAQGEQGDGEDGQASQSRPNKSAGPTGTLLR